MVLSSSLGPLNVGLAAVNDWFTFIWIIPIESTIDLLIGNHMGVPLVQWAWWRREGGGWRRGGKWGIRVNKQNTCSLFTRALNGNTINNSNKQLVLQLPPHSLSTFLGYRKTESVSEKWKSKRSGSVKERIEMHLPVVPWNNNRGTLVTFRYHRFTSLLSVPSGCCFNVFTTDTSTTFWSSLISCCYLLFMTNQRESPSLFAYSLWLKSVATIQRFTAKYAAAFIGTAGCPRHTE